MIICDAFKMIERAISNSFFSFCISHYFYIIINDVTSSSLSLPLIRSTCTLKLSAQIFIQRIEYRSVLLISNVMFNYYVIIDSDVTDNEFVQSILLIDLLVFSPI